MSWNLVCILDRTIETTQDIKFVDQATRSAGCATKVVSWVRMSSIGPNELKFGTHTFCGNRNDLRH
jgi:hypothetical protein